MSLYSLAKAPKSIVAGSFTVPNPCNPNGWAGVANERLSYSTASGLWTIPEPLILGKSKINIDFKWKLSDYDAYSGGLLNQQKHFYEFQRLLKFVFCVRVGDELVNMVELFASDLNLVNVPIGRKIFEITFPSWISLGGNVSVDAELEFYAYVIANYTIRHYFAMFPVGWVFDEETTTFGWRRAYREEERILTTGEPIARFSTMSPGEVNVPMQFSNKSEPWGFAAQYLWDFGDGTTISERSPSHIYKLAGLYNVTLQVTTQLGSNSDSANVEVVDRPPYPTFSTRYFKDRLVVNEDFTPTLVINNLGGPGKVFLEYDVEGSTYVVPGSPFLVGYGETVIDLGTHNISYWLHRWPEESLMVDLTFYTGPLGEPYTDSLEVVPISVYVPPDWEPPDAAGRILGYSLLLAGGILGGGVLWRRIRN